MKVSIPTIDKKVCFGRAYEENSNCAIIVQKASNAKVEIETTRALISGGSAKVVLLMRNSQSLIAANTRQ